MILEILTKADLHKMEEKLDQVIHLVQTTDLGGEKIYSPQQLAKKLHVSTKTIYTWKDQRLIEYSQINNKIFFREKAIEAFLASHCIKRFAK